MSRTTDQWKNLLDGATEGPWVANIGGFGRVEGIGPISSGFSIGDGLDCDEEDAELAAAAPEAVAEVIRLREALEERLRVWNKVAEKLEAAEHMSNAEVVRHTIHVVERILNPEEEA